MGVVYELNFIYKRNTMAVVFELKNKSIGHRKRSSTMILERKELLRISGNGQKSPNKFEKT